MEQDLLFLTIQLPYHRGDITGHFPNPNFPQSSHRAITTSPAARALPCAWKIHLQWASEVRFEPFFGRDGFKGKAGKYFKGNGMLPVFLQPSLWKVSLPVGLEWDELLTQIFWDFVEMIDRWPLWLPADPALPKRVLPKAAREKPLGSSLSSVALRRHPWEDARQGLDPELPNTPGSEGKSASGSHHT